MFRLRSEYLMSELFINYEKDFTTSLEATKSQLERTKQSASCNCGWYSAKNNPEKMFKEVKGTFSEAERALKYLETECGSIPP